MRQIIKLTESDLHKIVKESVNRILKENETWREEDWNPNYPHDDDEDDEKEWDSERYYERKYGKKN